MNPSELYLNRIQKAKDTILFKNNSVTTCYTGIAAPAKHMGVLMKDFLTDPDTFNNTTINYINEINAITPIDSINTTGTANLHLGLTTMWFSKLKIPGRELPDDSLWQVDEKKVMQDEDYDLVIDKGYNALFQKIIPQVVDMSELSDFGAYMQEHGGDLPVKLMQNDYPVLTGTTFGPPFEVLCGARSMNQFFMDCYKIPEKVKAAQDAMYVQMKKDLETTLSTSNSIGVWVGGWRGASALVSPKIWDNLVWPYMKDAALTCLKYNVTPIFHLDQSWDRDIERFKELPAKSCILNTDGMTNLAVAKKKLGEHVAFMGDVPAPLLAAGSVTDVKDYVKKLLDDIGTKGVFLTAGCDAPQNTKFENMVAMFEAGNDYK